MQKMLADYAVEFLAARGINAVFTVAGNGNLFLCDAFNRNKNFQMIHNHHEQACTMAAEGYNRIDGQLAAVCINGGAGGISSMTGVLCAWQDDVPIMIISGSADECDDVTYLTGEAYDIIPSVAPMTKFAHSIKDAAEVRFILEKAFYIATHGRRGPVWVDIPMSIQRKMIEPNELKSYVEPVDHEDHSPKVKAILEKLMSAKRPLILASEAIRRVGAYDDFRAVVDKLKVPVVAAVCVADILPNKHPYYFYNFGSIGGRTGNFLVQNADVILSLGCRLSLGQIGFNYKAFAPQAYKIVVDIELDELKKETLSIDMPVLIDLAVLLKSMNEMVEEGACERPAWLAYANEMKQNLREYNDLKDLPRGVSQHRFIMELMKYLKSDAVLVNGTSTSLYYGTDGDNQRYFGNRNCGTMGYDLPAAIGAAVANKGQVFCLTGDGGIQMNLQEFQTVVQNKIPVKLIVYNNNGYQAIVRTHTKFFNGRMTGCTPETGLSCPDWEKVCNAYGIPYEKITYVSELDEKLPKFINAEGFGFCEVIDDNQSAALLKTTSKKLDSGEIISAPIDELAPKLSDEDFQHYRYYREENYCQ